MKRTRQLLFLAIFCCIALYGNTSTLRAAPVAELTATQLIERAQSTLHAAKKGADYKSAVADLTSAIALEPKNTRAYFWRGEAIRWALRFQNANPLSIADADFDEKIFDGNLARKDYDKAIELDPKNARAYFGRAVLRRPNSDAPNASELFERAKLADLDKAIALDPKLGEAYLQRAFLKSQSAKPNTDELFSDYDNAVKLGFDAKSQDPIFAVLVDKRLISAAYSGRGLIWALRNQNEKALTDFNDAIAADSDNAEALVGREKILHGESPDDKTANGLKISGDKLVSAGKPDDALQEYSRALELDPQNASVYDARALLFARLNRWDEAFADLDNAIAIAPDDATWHVHRGSLRARRGDWENAVADLEDALALDPQSAGAWEQMGIAQQAQGEYSQAEISYQQAINLEGQGEAPLLRSARLAPLRLLIVRAVQNEPDAEQENVLTHTTPQLLSAGVLLAEIEIKKHPDSEPLKTLRARMMELGNIF